MVSVIPFFEETGNAADSSPTTTKTTLDNATSKRHKEPSITKILWPFYRYFILFGFLAVSRKTKSKSSCWGKLRNRKPKDEDQNEELFYFKWLSISNLFILLMQGIHSSWDILATKAIYFSSGINNLVANLMITFGLSQSLIVAFSTWLKGHSTARVLNGWNTIEREYLKTFSCPLPTHKLNQTVRKIYYGGFAYCTFLTLASVMYFRIPWNALGIISFTFSTGMIFAYVGTEFSHFVVCSVMAHILDKSCNEVKNITETEELAKTVTAEVIGKWKRFFILANDQLKAVSDSLSPTWALITSSRIFMLTLSSYILLFSVENRDIFWNDKALTNSWKALKNGTVDKDINSFNRMPFSTIVFVASSICFGGILQLFLEVYFAEKIHKNNMKIINTFMCLDTHKMDFDTKFEVKALISILHKKPNKLIYCDTIPVDWKLILTVFTSSLFYLIVLLQLFPLDSPSSSSR